MRFVAYRRVAVLFAVYLLVSAIAYVAGDAYVHAWLPLLGQEVDWLLPDGFTRASLGQVRREGQRLIVLEALTSRTVDFAGFAVPAGAQFVSATLQAYLFHHAAIVYAVLAAWPVESRAQRVRLFLLGIPCLIVTTSLDIPFVLVGLMTDSLLASVAPERLPYDPLAVYYAFLHRGGRFGLAIVAAVAVALTSRPNARGEATSDTR